MKNKKFKTSNNEIKPKRGIYFLFNKNSLVYIGQSEFIEKRIFDHVGSKNFDSWNYIEHSKETSLNEIEADLILKYQPFYNKTIPANNLWISRGVLSRIYDISMLKSRRLIKEEKVDFIKFNNTEYLKWGNL